MAQMEVQIKNILDDVKGSYLTDERKLEELCNLRSSSSNGEFLFAFCKALTPIFQFRHRTSSIDRVVRFVTSFAVLPNVSPHFLDKFLVVLLGSCASSSNLTSRTQAAHIISEIILRLPEDEDIVIDQVLDEVIEVMEKLMKDEVPIIRNFAARALSRFVDEDRIDLQNLFLESLDWEPIEQVRKTLLLSLPPSDATSVAIIDCTLDKSESVREAAFIVLVHGFPIQSLSINQRTIILERGLSDCSPNVVKECMELLKDEWFNKCCGGDPVDLLKFLDIETYEDVGVSVIEALLREKVINFEEDERIQQLRGFTRGTHLVEPEVALYWRVVCFHLQTEATYAAQSSAFLEKVLPETIPGYIELVNAHIAAGRDYRFVARQLLMWGVILDFDATNASVAKTFVQELLHKAVDYQVDEVDLGWDREWASAVYGWTKRVHSDAGECEEIIIAVIKELAQPCKDTNADSMHWMHCLALTALLLENVQSLDQLQIEPNELLHSLFLPGARHVRECVQRAAIKCLGLYGSLEREPNEEVVKQIRNSFINGSSPMISYLAVKALIDKMKMWDVQEDIGGDQGLFFSPQEQQLDSLPPDVSNNAIDDGLETTEVLNDNVENEDQPRGIDSSPRNLHDDGFETEEVSYTDDEVEMETPNASHVESTSVSVHVQQFVASNTSVNQPHVSVSVQRQPPVLDQREVSEVVASNTSVNQPPHVYAQGETGEDEGTQDNNTNDVVVTVVEQPPEGSRQPTSLSVQWSPVYINGVKVSRKRVPWEEVEVDTLREGVRKFGVGHWAAIVKAYPLILGGRTSSDVRVKWRNLSKQQQEPN